jgi:hypothetical protein
MGPLELGRGQAAAAALYPTWGTKNEKSQSNTAEANGKPPDVPPDFRTKDF